MNPIFDSESWKNYCLSVIRPLASKIDEQMSVPPDIWEGIRSYGYLKLFHPEKYPDYKISPNLLYEAMENLARASATVFWKATVSSALCGRMISELGNGNMKNQWITKLATGEVVGCFAATEIGSGSDPNSYYAVAKKVENGWILDAHKTRVTNAIESNVAAILSHHQDESGKAQGLCLVIADLDAVQVTKKKHSSMGLQGMGWGSLKLNSASLPLDSVISGITMANTLKVVEWGQVIQAMCGVGLAIEALDLANEFISSRESFGKKLAEFPMIKKSMEEMKDELEGVRIILKKVVDLKSSSETAGELIITSKIYSSEMAVRACELSMRVCGGWGYTKELGIERLLRDSYGNIPSGLPNDRLRELLISERLGIDPWCR